ncbi:transcriptional regulator [Halorussus gelatinilyticus]|uniref:Transcriptional regulator n=1 Tax=Halorussus gelatinilyticus TaxID=2937524 RepID=A0A8U0IKB1_9EURY|nr:transcriptional regulator [Halorussus gelatinilyticus]UPW00489.1 transcriptional regulator [Halorussus gelatinilyticus]
MVKSTVRFPEPVVEEIEALVEDGVVESKSEFHRFCSEYVLAQLDPDFEPETLDFEELEDALIRDAGPSEEEGLSFLESVLFIRKHALRGNVQDAEDFIDHHYDPADRDAVLLEELLSFYHESSPDSAATPRRSVQPEQR